MDNEASDTLSRALTRERQIIVDEFIRNITSWAAEQDRDVAKELGMVGQTLMSQSERYRPRLHIYNWFKKAYAAKHMEMALAELIPGSAEFNAMEEETNHGRKGKMRMDLSNRQADLVWNGMTDERRAEIEQEYTDSSTLLPGTYAHANNSLPSTPSKKKPKTIAQTRKRSMAEIVNSIKRTVEWADDHEFDIACYIADRHMREYGGALFEQLGTEIGLYFMTTVSERGIAGEALQILAQAKHARIFVLAPQPQLESDLPHDPIRNAFPAVSKKANGCKQRLAKAIRASIKSKINELLSDETQHLVNVSQDAKVFLQKLAERELQVIIKPDVPFTLTDILRRDGDPHKLERILSALILNRVTIQKVNLVPIHDG